jgi:hypothetical protein
MQASLFMAATGGKPTLQGICPGAIDRATRQRSAICILLHAFTLAEICNGEGYSTCIYR